MPNWCSNVATISHGNIDLIDAIETELNKEKDDVALFQSLRPRPAIEEENWYGWNCDNWGTKWEASVYDFERLDETTIRVNFDTAWGPPIALYEYLFEEGYDTTAYYNEDGMAFCGKFEFGADEQYDYSDMNSAEVQDEIPSDIDEMFCISEMMQDRESEEDDSEWEDEESHAEYTPPLETTDWFSFITKPVHKGIYEVKTTSWPFPQKAEWTGKKWKMEGNNEITEWRGITEEEHLRQELTNLTEEFVALED
jgi:hypothetical protein